MIRDVPTFAVVGAVNHGKSAVVAAIAEDDQVRVSSMPGETVTTQRFGLRDLLVLFDTPGFQNARKALAAIEALDGTGDPLEPFRTFIDRHRDDDAFEAECRLLQPIVDGAGIIYVVDGSRPLRDIHRCEMEVLRRTGAPRLAVINRTADEDHVEAWRGQLNQHFNIVREFDAHRVTYADRKDLVESLAIIERGWKDRLGQAVVAMETEWTQRVAEAAALIAALLFACLAHVEKGRLDGADATGRDAQVEVLRRRYMQAVASLEHDTHRKLIALYAHHRVQPDALPAEVFRDDLFGEETWQLFGLGVRQLIGVSAVAGGLAGAGIDAATLGHSLGIGTALGAAAGAGGAYALGRKRPEISVAWPTDAMPRWMALLSPKNALRFAGGDLVVGPYKAENFPWILLDRALCVFAFVYTRSHARRDEAVLDIAGLRSLLKDLKLAVAAWTDADRQACQRVFRAASSGRQPSIEQVTMLSRTIETSLDRVTAKEAEIGNALGSTPA